MRHNAHGIIALTTMLLFLAACNRDTIEFGVSYGSAGEAIQLSALMPSCGCVTFEHTGALTGGDVPQPIEIVAVLHGNEVGSQILEPGEEQREKFDWAGSENSDRYQLRAYALNPADDSRIEPPLRPISSYVRFGEVTDRVPCGDSACLFGELTLSEAWESSVQDEVTHQRGVNLVSNSQMLDVSATRDTCGCLALQNISDVRLRVTSEQSGSDIGSQFLLPGRTELIGFDWAGVTEEDVYSLSVVLAPRMPDTATMTTAARIASQARTPATGLQRVRITNYVALIGQIDRMACGRNITLQPSINLMCPYGALGMNLAITENPPLLSVPAAIDIAPAAPAAAPGGTQTPAPVAPAN